MSYIIPIILALVLHLALAMSFIVHQFSDLQQSRAMPRHIQAQMYDLKAFSTSTQKEKTKAKDVKLAEEKKLEPKKTEPKVEKKPEPKPEPKEDKREEKAQQQLAERELQKQKKAEQRKVEAKKLKDKLEQKKAEALKQREIESKRKLAAKEKAEKEKQLKDKKRKADQEKKKLDKIAADKKAETEKKRLQKAQAAKVKKQQQRKREEQARITALAKQIADEEQFAADQVAKEMASGIDVYIKRMLKGNFRIPSTARNGIKALVRIKLLASGRVVAVDLIESSGNPAFDKAAEQAVWRTESFPRVAEISRASPEYFNRELRTFMMSFKPEDLRW
ncbi:MAG: cell envelope integrity protein TolA [Oceanospirillaceae bacterium]|nr:cell envelope integrity protein TolA [Oceanospirillaceae bacterium]